MTLEGSFALAAILSILLAPPVARGGEDASDVIQGDEGFVTIKDAKGGVREQSGFSRIASKRLEVTVTLENTLDRPNPALEFDLSYSNSDKNEPLHARLASPRELPPHGKV